MTITINGSGPVAGVTTLGMTSGTITGLSAGGLPDGVVQPADLTTGAPSWDSSGNLSFNSGYGSVATAYGCRAWVNFNGTGTVALRASGNVSSITDNGTGDYTVNFTNAMPDANYCLQGCTERNKDLDNGCIINQNTQSALTTTAARICTYAVGTGAVDKAQMYVAIFR